VALLDYVDPDDADETVRDLFAAETERYGEPSLFGRCLANAPDAYAARAAYVERLREAGRLDERTAELAYVAVSVANDCEYCVDSHGSQLVEAVGIDEDRVAALAAGDHAWLDDRDRAVVAYADAVATDPKRIGADDVAALREAGFDDAGVAELTLLCASACAANAFADALNVLPQDRPDEA